MANERRDNLFQAAVTAAWNKYLANNNYIPNNRSTFKDNLCPNTSFISNNGYELKTKLGYHFTTITFSELEQCLPRNVTLADISTDNNNAIKSSKHFAIQKNINDLKAAADKAKSAKNLSSSRASSHIKMQPIETASLNDNSSESQCDSSQYSTLHPSRMSNVTGNDFKHAEKIDQNKKTANQIILDTDKHWVISLLLILACLFFALFNGSSMRFLTTYDQKIKTTVPTQPVKPIEIPDPAQQMHAKVTALEDPNYPHLSAYISDYKKVAGMLARLQYYSLNDKSARSDLPTVLINANNSCKTERSIGIYNKKCKLLGIDFFEEELAYETDVEIITVIAHEWGHHLVNVSNANSKFSLNENEIVADCFAGLVLGFYHKNNLMTIQEVKKAGKMMMHLGNNGDKGIHPNAETRSKSFISAASYVKFPNSDEAKDYNNYCGSLDGILDKDKIAQAKLGWVVQ